MYLAIQKLQAEADFLKVNKLSADGVLREATALHARWPALPSDNKRKVAGVLVEKITIGENEIEITWSCRPTSEELFKNQQQSESG